jgi:hypothetical protein
VSDLGLRHRQSIRNTIVFFDPVLVDSEFEDLTEFVKSFVDQEGLYQFRINPTNVTTNKGKLTQAVLTEAGFERGYFGNALTTLSYRGSTGYMWLPQEIFNRVSRDTRLSPVMQKFIKFEMFYDRLDNDVMMLSHRGDLFRGAITRFNYTEQSTDPWQISYEFTMEAYTDEPGRAQLGNAIKRLSYKALLGEQVLPQFMLRALSDALGIGRVSDTVPGRTISSLI